MGELRTDEGSERLALNALARSYEAQPPNREPMRFHQRLPGYQPGRLIAARTVASALGVREVWIKDESNRYGLPAFKMLGASWAAYRALVQRLQRPVEPWSGLGDLRARLAPLAPLTLVAATAGNHGRALARVASMLGFQAKIFVPSSTTDSRVEAIRSEGASVTFVEGTYDDASKAAQGQIGDDDILVSDMAWPGYELIPQWAIDGYSTIFWEADELLQQQGGIKPEIVVVQIGCGALAASVVRHFRRSKLAARPAVVGVEPITAACAFASAKAGRMVAIPGPFDSIMAGLNAGTPSSVAWPLLQGGVDAFVKIDDGQARRAMRLMAKDGVVAGETGAAGVAGLIELVTGPSAERLRASHAELNSSTTVLVLCTEGATDPRSYRAIVDEGDPDGVGHEESPR
jgi:diaminopropionate ammonia-lyase